MNKHPSAQKRHRQSIKRHARNQAIRSRVRTFVKRVRESIDVRNASEASEQLQSAARAIDKAVTKGVLHRNTASRKISRLTRAVRTLLAPSS
ncbi:MAG: 30S ribosomal protein S20 [Deltaproteobacteria bacterium]|nr:30S ribosomal protein S20 [Deltaproteobacteria bacterium]